MRALCPLIKLKHGDFTTSNQRGDQLPHLRIVSASLWISESFTVCVINITHRPLHWDVFKHNWQTPGPPVLYLWAGVYSVFQTVIMTQKIPLVSIVCFLMFTLKLVLHKLSIPANPCVSPGENKLLMQAFFSMADNLLFLAKSDKAMAMAQCDTVATLLHLWCFRKCLVLKMLVLFWVMSLA